MLHPVLKSGVWCVYLLMRVGASPGEHTNKGNRETYVGITNHLAVRMSEHADGKVASTAHSKWTMVAVAPVLNREQAALVERWLKVGNSRQKRLEWFAASKFHSVTPAAYIMKMVLRAKMWDTGRTIRRGFGENDDPANYTPVID